MLRLRSKALTALVVESPSSSSNNGGRSLLVLCHRPSLSAGLNVNANTAERSLSSSSKSNNLRYRPTTISSHLTSSLCSTTSHHRFFSTNSTSGENSSKEKEEEETKIEEEGTNVNEEKTKKSLRDTIHKLQGDNDQDSDATKDDGNDILYKLSSAYDNFTTSVKETWSELVDSSKYEDINKKLSTTTTEITKSNPASAADDDNEAADKYTGSTAIMIIDEEENMSTYEKIQKRLSEAPIIQAALNNADKIYQKSGAKNLHEKASHISEDAREAWETSQNPWVYRATSIYDTLTEESEYAMVERELRDLDPDFSLEQWKANAEEVTLPRMMRLFLEGRIKDLKPFLGESVYNRMAAEARVRKEEGTYVDTNVLGIMNAEILNCMPDTVNKGSPIITMHFMCQQINCSRKKETDEIVEGSEDDIRAYSYVASFQREYDEENQELKWRIIDFMPNGAIAYI